MCLAVPMKLIKRDGDIGTVELGGVERQISLMLMTDAKVGEYLVVHAGFAIQRLDEDEAHKTLELLMQMNEDYMSELSLDFTEKKKEPEDDPDSE